MTADGNLFAARHAGNGGLAGRAIGSEAVATRIGSRWMKSGPSIPTYRSVTPLNLWLLQLAATEIATTESLA